MPRHSWPPVRSCWCWFRVTQAAGAGVIPLPAATRSVACECPHPGNCSGAADSGQCRTNRLIVVVRDGTHGEHHDAGTHISARGTRHDRAYRGASRRYHVHDDGLHHLREPLYSGRCGHGQRGSVRRHLPCGRVRLGPDGAVGQLSGGARARHGPQCLLHLRRGEGNGARVGDGAGRGVPVRYPVSDRQRDALARMGDQRDPQEPEARHCRGDRSLSSPSSV